MGSTSDFDVERPAHLSAKQTVLVYPNTKKENTDRQVNRCIIVLGILHITAQNNTCYQLTTTSEF
jgi:hypothetical protein